jgi:hypothetical protein
VRLRARRCPHGSTYGTIDETPPHVICCSSLALRSATSGGGEGAGSLRTAFGCVPPK